MNHAWRKNFSCAQPIHARLLWQTRSTSKIKSIDDQIIQRIYGAPHVKCTVTNHAWCIARSHAWLPHAQYAWSIYEHIAFLKYFKDEGNICWDACYEYTPLHKTTTLTSHAWYITINHAWLIISSHAQPIHQRIVFHTGFTIAIYPYQSVYDVKNIENTTCKGGSHYPCMVCSW